VGAAGAAGTPRRPARGAAETGHRNRRAVGQPFNVTSLTGAAALP